MYIRSPDLIHPIIRSLSLKEILLNCHGQNAPSHTLMVFAMLFFGGSLLLDLFFWNPFQLPSKQLWGRACWGMRDHLEER